MSQDAYEGGEDSLRERLVESPGAEREKTGGDRAPSAAQPHGDQPLPPRPEDRRPRPKAAVTTASRRDEIRRLRAEGMKLHEICKRLGVQKSAVNRALYPRVRDYEKVYNRERYRTQVCVKCGAPSTLNKHSKGSKRGLWCAECYRTHRKEALSYA